MQAARETDRPADAQAIARLGLGYCPEERGIFSSLSAEENLMLPPTLSQGRHAASSRSTRCSPTSRSARASQGTRLSGGEQQMLAVARILRSGARLAAARRDLGRPRPGDRAEARRDGDRLLRKQGYTIIMVEQNFRFAAPLADRFLVMEHGQVIQHFTQSGTPFGRIDRLHEYLGV